ERYGFDSVFSHCCFMVVVVSMGRRSLAPLQGRAIKAACVQLYRPPSVSRLGTKRILTAWLWVPCRVSCRRLVASDKCVHSVGRGWAVILIHITGRSSRQRYAPQRFVHALRALLHKPLFRYAPRLNSSVCLKPQKTKPSSILFRLKVIVGISG